MFWIKSKYLDKVCFRLNQKAMLLDRKTNVSSHLCSITMKYSMKLRKHVGKKTKLISSKHVLLVINSLVGNKPNYNVHHIRRVEKLKPM